MTPSERPEPIDLGGGGASDAAGKAAGGDASGSAIDGLLIRCGNTFFKTRNALFPIAFVVFALATRPLAAFGSERADRWMDAAGVLVAVAGQALRALVIGLAYIRRGGKDGKVHADTLVTEGLFAHSRNPLYVGNMLVFMGLFVVLNSVWGYVVGIPFFLFAYLSIVRAEEDFLSRRFGGAYEDYCRRVNRFVPSLAGLGATIRGMAFDWRRLVRKEYGSTFTWITTAIALHVWETYVRQGFEAARPVLRAALVAWAPVVLGYATARYLKKTGRLKSD